MRLLFWLHFWACSICLCRGSANFASAVAERQVKRHISLLQNVSITAPQRGIEAIAHASAVRKFLNSLDRIRSDAVVSFCTQVVALLDSLDDLELAQLADGNAKNVVDTVELLYCYVPYGAESGYNRVTRIMLTPSIALAHFDSLSNVFCNHVRITTYLVPLPFFEMTITHHKFGLFSRVYLKRLVNLMMEGVYANMNVSLHWAHFFQIGLTALNNPDEDGDANSAHESARFILGCMRDKIFDIAPMKYTLQIMNRLFFKISTPEETYFSLVDRFWSHRNASLMLKHFKENPDHVDSLVGLDFTRLFVYFLKSSGVEFEIHENWFIFSGHEKLTADEIELLNMFQANLKAYLDNVHVAEQANTILDQVVAEGDIQSIEELVQSFLQLPKIGPFRMASPLKKRTIRACELAVARFIDWNNLDGQTLQQVDKLSKKDMFKAKFSYRDSFLLRVGSIYATLVMSYEQKLDSTFKFLRLVQYIIEELDGPEKVLFTQTLRDHCGSHLFHVSEAWRSGNVKTEAGSALYAFFNFAHDYLGLVVEARYLASDWLIMDKETIQMEGAYDNALVFKHSSVYCMAVSGCKPTAHSTRDQLISFANSRRLLPASLATRLMDA